MIIRRANTITLIAIAAGVVACSDGTVGVEDAPAGPSRAFGIWEPGPFDTCTPEIHDQYATVGPDGKLYPTWHPAVDPESGCRFGHEHGRDPSGSALFAEVGRIPFGYANEVGDLFAPHVGYKVEWENDVPMDFDNAGEAIFQSTCDVLVGLHQGSAGAGAFVNPHHELVYHAHCTGGIELHMTFIATIDDEGLFIRSCGDGEEQIIVAAIPGGAEGSGHRRIPDRSCVEQHILVADGSRSDYREGLHESWQMSERIRTTDRHTLVSVGPYFQVFNPSRFHDPSSADGVGRPMAVCYEVTATGNRARGGLCAEATDSGRILDITWNDPRSLFDGTDRKVDINRIRLSNAGGPRIWYSDAFGENAQTEPFEGSIRQIISAIDNTGLEPHGPDIGRDRVYRDVGVHPPN